MKGLLCALKLVNFCIHRVADRFVVLCILDILNILSAFFTFLSCTYYSFIVPRITFSSCCFVLRPSMFT